MPNWQTILPALAVPQARLLRRQRAFLAAAAALLAMLLLGWAVPGPEAPGFAMAARRLGMPALAMLPAVAGAGLIAHHLARLTVLPRADPFAAALAATLVAAATLPGLGVAALIVPQLLALPALAGPRRDRVVALLVQCIAILAAMGAGGSAAAPWFAYATMLAGAGFSLLRPCSGAANDNPSMERAGQFSRLLQAPCYASGDSQSGEWEIWQCSIAITAVATTVPWCRPPRRSRPAASAACSRCSVPT